MSTLPQSYPNEAEHLQLRGRVHSRSWAQSVTHACLYVCSRRHLRLVVPWPPLLQLQ